MAGNLSLVSWNVDCLFENLDGTRTYKTSYPDFIKSLSRFDIVCLEETHLESHENFEIPGYEVKMNCRRKSPNANRAYGGLAIAVRVGILPCIEFLPNKSTEYMWMKLKKQYFGLDKDLFIAVVYISPVTSPFCKNNDNVFDLLEIDAARFSKLGDVFYGGDWNAYTGTREDYVKPFDCVNMPFPNFDSGEMLPRPRNNLDTRVPRESTSHGPALLDFCKTTGAYILNGRTLGDSEGQFTCRSYNGEPSTIDYMLCTNLDLIKFFHVSDPTVHSIHSMISVVFRFSVPVLNRPSDSGAVHHVEKFKWEKGDDEKFRRALEQPQFQIKIESLLNSNDISVDEFASETTNLLTDASDLGDIRRAGKKRTGNRTSKASRGGNQGWYDRECAEYRRRVKCLARDMRKDPFNRALLGEFRSLRKTYKKLLRHKKTSYRNKILDEMETLRISNPTAYWKLFEQLSNQGIKSKPNISGDEWLQHFQTALNSDAGTTDHNFIEEAIKKVKEEGGQHFDELSFTIQQDELHETIRGLKRGKASSQDLILNEMLKAGENQLVPLLTKLFNRVLCSESGVPKPWREE